MKSPFKTKEQTFAPLMTEVMSQVQKAPLMGDSESAARTEARLKRPGDQPLKGYVGHVKATLTKARDEYTTELNLLNRDIAKLQEDKRQIIVALDGIKSALEDIAKTDKPVKIDERQLEADIAADLAADENKS